MTKRSETMVMPFGKHKGETLGDIADTDLLYLDWLNGRDLSGGLMVAVADICARRARQIERLLDEREDQLMDYPRRDRRGGWIR